MKFKNGKNFNNIEITMADRYGVELDFSGMMEKAYKGDRQHTFHTVSYTHLRAHET